MRTMDFRDDTRIWVIFDTSTKKIYYQDVLNLIALPQASTIRYDYRREHISNQVLRDVDSGRTLPKKVLLVYAQSSHYARGSNDPPPQSPGDIVWAATRLAEMLLVIPDGDVLSFDLKLLGYPANNLAVLQRMLDPQISRREVPFDKWVAFSEDIAALATLEPGDEGLKWQTLVDRVGSFPFQFRGSSFWRVRGPFRSGNPRLITPTYVTDKITDNGQEFVRKISAAYSAEEQQTYTFEVITHTPPAGGGQPDSEADIPVTLTYEAEGAISLVDGGTVTLRRHASTFLRVSAKREDTLEDRGGILKIKSADLSDHWPGGPSIEVRFLVYKSSLKVLVGVITGLLAVGFGGYAAFGSDFVARILMTVGAAGLALISGVLLTGKVQFKVG